MHTVSRVTSRVQLLGGGDRPHFECKVVFPAEAAPMPVLSAAEGPPEAGLRRELSRTAWEPGLQCFSLAYCLTK